MEFQQILGYSKTRWLALKPAIERVLRLFKPLKVYFSSHKQCPTILRQFFENPCAEPFLYFVHNQSAVFHDYILKVESQKASMAEIAFILKDLRQKLIERKCESFLPLTVDKMLKDLEREGNDIERFKETTLTFYNSCIEYLNQWTVHFEEMENFNWILLRNLILWREVKEALEFILAKRPNSTINDNGLFDEVTCVKNFVTLEKIKEWNDREIEADSRWLEIFAHFKSQKITFENIYQVVEFFLSLPGSNAPTERVFSMMKNYWADEKSRLNIDTLKAALLTMCNYEMNCLQFSDYLSSNINLLEKIHSNAKYNSKPNMVSEY